MTASVKLDPDGKCILCKKTSSINEHVQCIICKDNFHAVCPSVSSEDKLATKTTVQNFLLSSTKKNFAFLCDICLTKMEINTTGTDTQRINSLESKMKQLLLKKDVPERPGNNVTEVNSHSSKQNSIWYNKERLETVKAPPAPSVLVVGKTNEQENDQKNLEVVEKVIMENNIGLKKSYKNKSGELVLVCESKETRDNLSNIVESIDKRIPTKSPNGKRPTIAIVGLYKEYTTEEVISMMIKQNDFIKKFATTNNIDDHCKVLVVRPTKRNAGMFQVFVSVSAVLRDGIKQHNDKITLGLTSCKVYDQYHVKRCNKCQFFGHYAKDCTSTEDYCAKCGEMHETANCTSTLKKCINCVRSDVEKNDHCAFDNDCPAIVTQQEILKNIIEKDRLNLAGYITGQTT